MMLRYLLVSGVALSALSPSLDALSFRRAAFGLSAEDDRGALAHAAANIDWSAPTKPVESSEETPAETPEIGKNTGGLTHLTKKRPIRKGRRPATSQRKRVAAERQMQAHRDSFTIVAEQAAAVGSSRLKAQKFQAWQQVCDSEDRAHATAMRDARARLLDPTKAQDAAQSDATQPSTPVLSLMYTPEWHADQAAAKVERQAPSTPSTPPSQAPEDTAAVKKTLWQRLCSMMGWNKTEANANRKALQKEGRWNSLWRLLMGNPSTYNPHALLRLTYPPHGQWPNTTQPGKQGWRAPFVARGAGGAPRAWYAENAAASKPAAATPSNRKPLGSRN